MRFYIRTTKKEGFATLYTDIQRRNPKVKIKLSVPIIVDIKEWARANKTPQAFIDYLNAHPDIADKMRKVHETIKAALTDGVYDSGKLAELVNDTCYKEQRERAAEIEKMRKAERKARENTPLLYIESLIERMKDGRIRTKANKPYAKKYIETYSSLLVTLKKFRTFSWDDIDKRFADEFSAWMQEREFLPNTINARIRNLKIVCTFAHDEGIHTNTQYIKALRKIEAREDEARTEIYLTNDELQALYSYPLVGKMAEIRDVFLIGCYTCQRYSDYSKIEKVAFTTTAKGTKVVKLIQKKTSNSVTIPILNNNLLAIMKRYKYKIPSVKEWRINYYLPRILKEISANVPSLATMERTKLTKAEADAERKAIAEAKAKGSDTPKVLYERDEQGQVIRPRYELVSTHTARRSGITNLYLSGLFDIVEMMSISGHKDAETFKHYIRTTKDEMADKIADKIAKSETKIM